MKPELKQGLIDLIKAGLNQAELTPDFLTELNKEAITQLKAELYEDAQRQDTTELVEEVTTEPQA